MVISSTCFPHKETHKQTWRFPDGKTNNKIDHIFIDKRNASSIQDVKSRRGASSDSDPSLVRGKCRCKIAYSKQEPNRNAEKFHAETLTEPSTVMRFQQQLRKEFEKTENERAAEEEINLEEEWKRIKEVTVEGAEQTIGYTTKTGQERMV
jgi:hypothetical protein